MNLTRLRESLKHHEGKRLKPYKDSVGVLTIGYGRNLDHVGISEAEAEALLDNDIRSAYQSALRVVPTLPLLTDARQEVVVEMTFNLGATRFGKFTKTLALIDARDWTKAALEMLDSRWAEQVGQRASTLSEKFRKG